METNELEKELTTKIKTPKEIKEAIYTKLCKNLCMAIVVLLYFIFVYMGYIKLNASVFEGDLHVFAGILIILTIASFEIAFRNSNKEIGIHGIELLFLSIVTLFMPYIYFHRGNILKFTYSFVSIYITIYYLVKCIVIYIVEIRKYRSGLSDIKEIIDDEEDETYLDEPNERKFRDIEDDDTIIENRDSKESKKQVKKINDTEDKSKKKTAVKKKENTTSKVKKSAEKTTKTKTTTPKGVSEKGTTKKSVNNNDEKDGIDKKKKTTKKTTTKKKTTKTEIKED